MKPVIEVKNISKKYLISHLSKPEYGSFREDMVKAVKKPIKFLLGRKENKESLWALEDVSFTVEPGDIVGLIGKNGSGKSTLLKILSRIVVPTTGEAVLRGRVASLLEVGTGFHPELTGRENIFLNGSILGMKRSEIVERFDDIVEFAGTEKFLDTPVKFYSSGMYVRLAFAVAAHLESDILLIDEVLAVGDAEFQKKCLARMNDVAKAGRTIVFVSHNMNAVESLCNKVVYLEKGSVKESGSDVSSIILNYLFGENRGEKANTVWANDGTYKNEYFEPKKFFIGDVDGNEIHQLVNRQDDIYLYIHGLVKNIDPALTIGYAMYTSGGTSLYWSYPTDVDQKNWPALKNGNIRLRNLLPTQLLNEGEYRIELIGGLHNREWLFTPGHNNPVISFEIKGPVGTSPYLSNRRPTALAPIIPWEAKI